MTANTSTHPLLKLSEAIKTWAKGSDWDEGLVKDCLDKLRTAGEADTSKPCPAEIFNGLKETVDGLAEYNKHKIVGNKTCSELWRCLSAASLQVAVEKFNAAEQKYREYINPEGLAVGKVCVPFQRFHVGPPLAAFHGVPMSPSSVVATG